MSRFYIVQDGERLYAATQAAARKLAKLAANATRKAVTVYQDAGGGHRRTIGGAKPQPKPKPRAKAVKAKRNPVMRGHNYTGELWEVTAIRPTPPRRLAHAWANTAAEARVTMRELAATGYRDIRTTRVAEAKKNPARKAAPRRR